ncbi:hypothetical protein DFH09DRAFT_1323682 [Mycena vulgaris]|nr:hypothetical protein DFH09DRAFT_1323682 [Mycena vulgaris]
MRCPQAHVATEDHDNVVDYNPNAFGAANTLIHDVHAFTTDSNVHRKNGFVYNPNTFAGTDAHPIGAANAQRPCAESLQIHSARAGAATARTGNNRDPCSIPAGEPITAVEHYPHLIADHMYGFAGVQHDSSFAYNPHTLARERAVPDWDFAWVHVQRVKRVQGETRVRVGNRIWQG